VLQAYTSKSLFSLRASFSSQIKLDDEKLFVIHSLGIARESGVGLGVARKAQVKRSTKGEFRAGMAAKRARAA